MQISALKQEYKELYLREVSKRELLNNAMGLPISLIGAFGSVLYLVVREIKSEIRAPITCLQIIELSLAAIASVLIACAIYNLVRSYFGYPYLLPPTPIQLEQHNQKLVEYYASKGSAERDSIDGEVLEYIFETYIKGAHENAAKNAARSDHMYRSKQLIVAALIPIVLLGLFRATSGLGQYF
jgi:hypothetical protein